MVEFERNKYGHITVSFAGLDLTGKAEVARAHVDSCRASPHAVSCFTRTGSRKFRSYDDAHRLVSGKIYRVAFIPGDEIKEVTERTTENFQKLGYRYGYGTPLAGLIPRIHETVSLEQRKELGVWSIVCLHAPLGDIDRDPLVLRADRDVCGVWIGACYGEPTRVWREKNFYAFAFPVLG